MLFQVVPPCGGHLLILIWMLTIWSFKSCPRVGGIKMKFKLSQLHKSFQVVPPCGGHLNMLPMWSMDTGFKSCPRVGGIFQRKNLKMNWVVSSRAPVWGASADHAD